MTAENKNDLTELVLIMKQLNPTGLLLMKNSADTLLSYQRMSEKTKTETVKAGKQ